MIDFKCPKCKQLLSSPESMAGQEETCPNCGNIAAVPQPAPPVKLPDTHVPPVAPPVFTHAIPQVRLDVNVKGIKSTNGLGIAALVLGILAVLTCWVPFVGMLGIPLAVLGLVFGIIGFLIALIGRKSGVGMPVSGCIVCVVSIVVAVASTGSTVAAVDESRRQAREQNERSSLAGHSVVAGQHPAHNSPSSTESTTPSRSPSPAAPFLSSAVDNPALPEKPNDTEKKAYLAKVLLTNVEVAKTVLGDKGVFGEVKNAGDRAIKEVAIMVYCLDKDGKEVFEKSFHPVLVTDSAFSMRDGKPLKPNYSEKFGYRLDDAPSEWSGQVRVVISNIEFADAQVPFEDKLDGPKKAYVDKVLLNKLEVGKSVLDEKGLFGEVKNTGDRSLKEVAIIIYCLDKDGREVFEKTYHPVLVTDSGFTTRDNKPLKPNYSQKFGCKLADAPSEWSDKVRVVITNIEFAD